jgi:hypothetical protein
MDRSRWLRKARLAPAAAYADLMDLLRTRPVGRRTMTMPDGRSSLLVVLAAVLISGCAVMSQFAPKYQRDKVDDFYDKAMEIQAVFENANADLLRIRQRLVAMVDEVRPVEARNAVRDVKSVLKRLGDLPGRGKELLGVGQALITSSPKKYLGVQALNLPKKLGLLKEAIAILAGLGDQVGALADSGTKVMACGSALVQGGDRSPCEDSTLADLGSETGTSDMPEQVASSEGRTGSPAAARVEPVSPPAQSTRAAQRHQQPIAPLQRQEERIRRLRLAAVEAPNHFLAARETLLRQAAEEGDTEALLAHLRDAIDAIGSAERLVPWVGLAACRLGLLPRGLVWMGSGETRDPFLLEAKRHYESKTAPRLRVIVDGVPDDDEVRRALSVAMEAMAQKYGDSPAALKTSTSEVRMNLNWILDHASLPAVLDLRSVTRPTAGGNHRVELEWTYAALKPEYQTLEFSVNLEALGYEPVVATIAASGKPRRDLSVRLRRAAPAINAEATRSTHVRIAGFLGGDRVSVDHGELWELGPGEFRIDSTASKLTVFRSGWKIPLPVPAERGGQLTLQLPALLRLTADLQDVSVRVGSRRAVQVTTKPRVFLLTSGETITVHAQAEGRYAHKFTLTPRSGENLKLAYTDANLPVRGPVTKRSVARGGGRGMSVLGGILLASGTTVAVQPQLDATTQALGVGAGIGGLIMLFKGLATAASNPKSTVEGARPVPQGIGWAVLPWLGHSAAGASLAVDMD